MGEGPKFETVVLFVGIGFGVVMIFLFAVMATAEKPSSRPLSSGELASARARVVARQEPPEDPRATAFRVLSQGLVERMCTGEDAQRLAAEAVRSGVTFSVEECRRVGTACAGRLARQFARDTDGCDAGDEICSNIASAGMDADFERCFVAHADRLIQ